jgi:PilZ domain
VPSLSEHVDWAVRRAVLADPDRRFGSCPELIAALTGTGKDATDKGSKPARRLARGARTHEKERRAGVRYECALPTACIVNDSLHPDATEWQSQWDAQVFDLSVGGIGLVVARRFEPGSVLTLDLASGDGRVKRTRQVQVVRVAPADRGRWFIGGVLTEKLSREELRLLL